jgi:hypothetical protein
MLFRDVLSETLEVTTVDMKDVMALGTLQKEMIFVRAGLYIVINGATVLAELFSKDATLFVLV